MQELFKKFLRMEIDFEKLKNEAELNLDGTDDYDMIKTRLGNGDGVIIYEPTVEDFVEACTNAQFSKNPEEKLMYWFAKLYSVLYDFYGFDKLYEKFEDYIPNIPVEDDEAVWHCFQIIKFKFFLNDEMNANQIIVAIIQAGETYKLNKGKEEEEFALTDEQIRGAIQIYTAQEKNDMLDEEEKEKYRKILDEGVERELVEAMEAKGYYLYGGNSLYDCNWEESRDLFEKLYEITGDGQYANTLGYIYFYGRCNGGMPEYDQAFKYFTCGHLAGYFESTYKLSDMYLNGKGIPQNKKVALDLVARIYNENLARFENGEFGCKFADVALRLGSFFENGHVVDRDLLTAYNYYLKARFAIEKRLEFDMYGDKKVFGNIEKSLDRVRDLVFKDPEVEKKFSDVSDYEFLPIINHLLDDNRLLRVNVKKCNDDEVMITGKVVDLSQGNENIKKILFTDPIIEEGYLSSEFIVFAKGKYEEMIRKVDGDIDVVNNEFTVFVDEIEAIFEQKDINDFDDPIENRSIENIDKFAKMRLEVNSDKPNNPIKYQFMYLNNIEFELDCVDFCIKKGQLVPSDDLIENEE